MGTRFRILATALLAEVEVDEVLLLDFPEELLLPVTVSHFGGLSMAESEENQRFTPSLPRWKHHVGNSNLAPPTIIINHY